MFLREVLGVLRAQPSEPVVIPQLAVPVTTQREHLTEVVASHFAEFTLHQSCLETIKDHGTVAVDVFLLKLLHCEPCMLLKCGLDLANSIAAGFQVFPYVVNHLLKLLRVDPVADLDSLCDFVGITRYHEA